jgi:hypothetical protein
MFVVFFHCILLAAIVYKCKSFCVVKTAKPFFWLRKKM